VWGENNIHHFLSEPLQTVGTKTNATPLKVKKLFQRTIDEEKELALFLSYIVSVNKILTNVTIQYYILPYTHKMAVLSVRLH